MPPNAVSKKVSQDDVFANDAVYCANNIPIAATSTGPGVIASDEPNAAWRNQDQAFLGEAPPTADLLHDPNHYLRTLFKQISQYVEASLLKHDTSKGSPGYHLESGCTATLCVMTPQKIVVANAGDCFATLIYKKNGRYHALRLTRAHRASDPKEQQRIKGTSTPLTISQASTPNHSPRLCLNTGDAKKNCGLSITRGFGASAYAPGFMHRPEITTLDLKSVPTPEEAIIVTGSDGFSDYVDDEELVDFFNQNSQLSLPEKARALRQKAYLEKGSQDNITVGVSLLHPGLVIGQLDGFGMWGRIAAIKAAEHFAIYAQLSILDTQHRALRSTVKKLKQALTLELNQSDPINIATLTEHPCIQLATATKNMLDIVTNPAIPDAVKILTVQKYHAGYVNIPRFKKYQALLFTLLCTVIGVIIGAIIGGLCSTPLFGVGAVIGAVKGGSIGAGIGSGAGGGIAGLHYLYSHNPHRYAAAAIKEVMHHHCAKTRLAAI